MLNIKQWKLSIRNRMKVDEKKNPTLRNFTYNFEVKLYDDEMIQICLFCNGTTLYHFFFHFPLPHFFSMWYDVCVSPTAGFVIFFVDHYYIRRHIYTYIVGGKVSISFFVFICIIFFFWRAYRLYHLLTYYHHYHDDFIILYKTYMTMSVCVCVRVCLCAPVFFSFSIVFFFVSFVCFCSFPLIMISSKHASRFTPFGRHLVDTNTQYIDFIHWRWGAIVGATFFLLPLCLSIFFYYITPSPKILLSVKCVFFFLFHFI